MTVKLNVQALAIENGIDPVIARDKDIFIETAIANSGLSVVGLENESIFVQSGVIRAYAVRLILSDSTSRWLLYGNHDISDDNVENLIRILDGANPNPLDGADFFSFSNITKNDIVKRFGKQPVTPTPTPLPVTPTPTPVAIPNHSYIVANFSDNITQKIKINSGLDSVYGSKPIPFPENTAYLSRYGIITGSPYQTGVTPKYYTRAKTTIDNSRLIMAFDMDIDNGLVNPRYFNLGEIESDFDFQIGVSGNQISTAYKRPSDGKLIVRLFNDTGTALVETATEFVSPRFSENLDRGTVTDRDSGMGIIDGSIISAMRNPAETSKMRSYDIVDGAIVDGQHILDFGKNISKSYFVNDKIVVVMRDETSSFDIVSIYSYSKASGFSLLKQFTASELYSEDAQLLSALINNIDISNPTKLILNGKYYNTNSDEFVFVSEIDVATLSNQRRYTAAVDPATLEPAVPDVLYYGFGIGESWTDEASIVKIYYLTSNNLQVTYSFPENFSYWFDTTLLFIPA